MSFDDDAAYQALTARDARFDGRLFIGVTSTRIYCRPICRVRTPRRENCRFFDTPAQAEAQSFRPCLKCRPEIAPGPGLPWSVMDASRTLARQAAQRLDAQAAEGEAPSVAQLAEQLGVSDRHLRRIFFAEHGVTPLQYLQTRRLLLAKQLLTDTALPVSQVALACGYRSLRRFNAAFAENYRMSPTRLRGDTPRAGASATAHMPIEAVTVALAYREPYDVVALLKFVTQRAIPQVESISEGTIRRLVRGSLVGRDAGWVEVEFMPASARLQLRFSTSLAPISGPLVAAVRRWLDLDADPHTIDAALAGLPGAPGLRLPGGIDTFELAVRAILGQQVTVAAARTLAMRLVDRYGAPFVSPWPELCRLFPAPAVLAAAAPGDIASLGIIGSRAAAIVALANAWPQFAEALQMRHAPELLIAQLCAVPGIGPWTAHYIAMRALGWPDAFPPNDVAVLKAMKQLYDIDKQRQADAHAQAWQPWRAYAVLRLWNSLEKTP